MLYVGRLARLVHEPMNAVMSTKHVSILEHDKPDPRLDRALSCTLVHVARRDSRRRLLPTGYGVEANKARRTYAYHVLLLGEQII